MKIDRDITRGTTSIVVTDEEAHKASGWTPKKASDLVVRLVHLIAEHGDLTVWASNHSEIDSAWFSEAHDEGRHPDCIMIG
jgi:hypothetical protein